jgi:hypothetical protein
VLLPDDAPCSNWRQAAVTAVAPVSFIVAVVVVVAAAAAADGGRKCCDASYNAAPDPSALV